MRKCRFFQAKFGRKAVKISCFWAQFGLKMRFLGLKWAIKRTKMELKTAFL
jgi:hypothetical protein